MIGSEFVSRTSPIKQNHRPPKLERNVEGSAVNYIIIFTVLTNIL